MSSNNCKAEPSDSSPGLTVALGILLDEKLPGPLYGLPAIDTDSFCSQARDTGRQGDLRMTLQWKRAQFELELLSRKATWNADLPIHSLPAEILLHIFEEFVPMLLPDRPQSRLWSQPDDEPEQPQRPWAQLMHVCRHWCALIRNGAFFWREIVISNRRNRWFDLALGRLGKVAIRIKLAPHCDLIGVLPMLGQHANQIEELVFGGSVLGMYTPHLRSFFSRPFPLLNHLALTMEPTQHSRPIRSSIYSNSPLRWVDLMQTALPWTKSLLTHLEVLCLTDCSSSMPALPFPDFLDVLEHGQRLRYPRLSGFLSSAMDSHTSAPHERLVALPNLQTLYCCDVPANIARLMTHLCTPTILRVTLFGDCRNGPKTPATVHASLLPEDASTQIPILQSITHATLDADADEITLRCYGPINFDLIIAHDPNRVENWAWEETWMERGLRQLPTLLGPALTEFEAYGWLDAVSQAIWDRVFDSFPALQVLIVGDWESETVPFDMLHSLASAPGTTRSVLDGSDSINIGEGPGRTTRVRCPALTHLEIDNWSWSRDALDQILDCLRVRAVHGASRLEYFGSNADGKGWEPEILPVLKEYRTQFLVVVDEFALDEWW